jgi:hypothetical protein
MGRLRGELDRGTSPPETIAKAKAFLDSCGVLERTERIVAGLEERARGCSRRGMGAAGGVDDPSARGAEGRLLTCA